MNTLFVLLDGAEDHPNPELNGKKPLDVARMPFIRSNMRTLGRTTGRGYTHLFLNEFFTGHPPKLQRAVLEALGLGMDMEGRTAYRLSPARIGDGMIRWAYDSPNFSEKLEECVRRSIDIVGAYDPQITFFINARAVLTLRSDLVPELPGPPVDAEYVPVPGDLGRMVESVADEMGGITDYPWGCGRFADQYPRFECLDNLKAFSDSPTSLGVCASLGYETEIVEDLDDRFVAAREALDDGNVFLHLDEVDEYSHMKDWRRKLEILEYMDRKMEENFSDCDRIIYFIDHGTSSITGEHLPIEVPFWTNYETDIGWDEFVPLDTLVPRLLR
ncbi:MAG: phosphoglycerate mutase [Candidatus Methanomethylophilaceae archaeon]